MMFVIVKVFCYIKWDIVYLGGIYNENDGC